MGNRHQMYIIARYPHGKYTCLTKVHFQAMYEEICQLVASFMALVKEPINAAVVESELHALDDPGNKNATGYVPCPYINKLIKDAEIEALHRDYGYFEPREDDPMDDHNDSGITVLDVSQPLTPGYCFACICSISGSTSDYLCTDSGGPPHLAPLSVKNYLECMYNLPLEDLLSPEFEEHSTVQRFYDGLKAEPVLPPSIFRDWDPYGHFKSTAGYLPSTGLRVLLTQDTEGNLIWDETEVKEVGDDQQKTWWDWTRACIAKDEEDEAIQNTYHGDSAKKRKRSPSPSEDGPSGGFVEFWRHKRRNLGESDEVICLLDTWCYTLKDFPLPPQPSLPLTVPSLAEMALSLVASLPNQAVSDLHLSFNIPINQFIAKKALEYLRTRDDMPEALFPLLTNSLKWSYPHNSRYLNLDGYPLTTHQLSSLSLTFADAVTLNLSNNPQINKETVQSLLRAIPTAKHLILVNCPSLAYGDMDELELAECFVSLNRVVYINGQNVWTLPRGLRVHYDLSPDDDND